MELSAHIQGKYVFTYANTSLVGINGTDYQENILVDNENIVSHDYTGFNNIDLDKFEQYLISFKPQLVIFATSESVAAISKDLVKILIKYSIGYEVMSVVAATRTFNFLIGEDRKVACLVFLANKG